MAVFLWRELLSQYGSAEALTRRKLIADLRQWADGLETQQLSERSVVLVHGTNLRKHRNSALLERFQRSVFFDRPGEPRL